MSRYIENKSSLDKLVSIVTITFNDLPSLKSTIRNVLNQRSENYQYLVIDGGSIDGTQEAIENYKDKIYFFNSEPDEGIFDAMNKGLQVASGEWINFMNAGDLFYSNNVLEEFFSRDLTGVDIIYGDCIADYNEFKIYKKAGNPDALWKTMNIRHQAMFVRTSLMKENKFDLSYPLGADFDFLFRAYKEKKRFLYIPKPVVIFNPDGISNTKILKVTREHHKILKKYVEYTPAMNLSYFGRLCYLSVINLTRILLSPKVYLKLLKFINRKNLVSNS